jgi:RNA polymerase sigma-70 factor (ECF subfamily)
LENNVDTIYIHRTINGDTGAFSFLVEKYQQMVYTLATKILGNNEDAEDAAQEVFVKCYRALKRYNGSAAFSTWLYKITYNHSIDVLKSKHKKWQITEWKNDMEPGIISHQSLDEKIDLKEIQILLKEAIHRLAPDEQLIVTLYYYEGLALKEIAEIIDIRENNVKIKLHRIRTKLQQLLKSKNEIISILNL